MDIWLSIFGPTTHGESAAEVAAGVRRAGANALLMLTSLYHGYRLLQPRYPHKAIYSLETDRVFWQPDLDYYRDSELQPQRSLELGSTDLVAELARACRAAGVRFSVDRNRRPPGFRSS